jgi:twitching motility protein PilT
MAKIDAFLRIMQENDASDLHIGAGFEPMLRIHGVLEKTSHRVLSEEEVKVLVYELLTDAQIGELEKAGELDCAYTLPGVARFRMNVFKKYPGIAAAFRIIPHTMPTLEALGLPASVRNMLHSKNGLILVTGPTGSGKSTTLAAMVNYLNEHMNYHMITLEDPLEFIHGNKNSLINQRQIGEHSQTFANALRAALREDPNVILVGEMRDLETIALAITAAELGLLVLGTLHTKSASQTISRVADAFPVDQQPAIRLTLSEVLVGMAALEVMVGTHAVRNLIREGKSHLVNNVIMTAKKEGMQLLDQHLKDLVMQNVVTSDEAARYAVDPAAILALGSTAKPTSAPAAPRPKPALVGSETK